MTERYQLWHTYFDAVGTNTNNTGAYGSDPECVSVICKEKYFLILRFDTCMKSSVFCDVT
jgi:hypothetical protein